MSRWWIADGHADSLMWNRDLCVRSSEGHVDFPRLVDAGVGLQCFPVVTRGYPLVDGFGLLTRYRGWPKEARSSLWQRACWQIDQLYRFCERSGGKVAVATRGTQLEENRAASRISAVLGVEGGQAIERRVERVRELHARGVRFMSLMHLANNELGGSSSTLMGNRALSPLGREVLEAMAEVGISVDLAHASDRAIAEILEHRRARPFSSHTGVRGATASWRNLSDEALRAVADRGGVVGIIYATIYVGGRSYEHVARHIEHAVKVAGEDAVALGSDFDGLVPLPSGMVDVTGVPRLGDLLVQRGMSERVAMKVMGENWLRFFRETL